MCVRIYTTLLYNAYNILYTYTYIRETVHCDVMMGDVIYYRVLGFETFEMLFDENNNNNNNSYYYYYSHNNETTCNYILNEKKNQ